MEGVRATVGSDNQQMSSFVRGTVFDGRTDSALYNES